LDLGSLCIVISSHLYHVSLLASFPIWGMQVLIASEFVSFVLALILVFFFLKAYRLVRSLFLVGLPVGFLFLAFSYVFLGISLICESDPSMSQSFLWLRLTTQSYGYVFIGFTYYFSTKNEEATRSFLVAVSLASFLSILLPFGILLMMPPFMKVPSVYVVDDFFRMMNLILLGYVVYHLVKHLKTSGEPISGLVWAPSAFSVLWVGQYSLLLWGIDGSQTALAFAHVARIVALLLLLRIYYASGRRV